VSFNQACYAYVMSADSLILKSGGVSKSMLALNESIIDIKEH